MGDDLGRVAEGCLWRVTGTHVSYRFELVNPLEGHLGYIIHSEGETSKYKMSWSGKLHLLRKCDCCSL